MWTCFIFDLRLMEIFYVPLETAVFRCGINTQLTPENFRFSMAINHMPSQGGFFAISLFAQFTFHSCSLAMNPLFLSMSTLYVASESMTRGKRIITYFTLKPLRIQVTVQMIFQNTTSVSSI